MDVNKNHPMQNKELTAMHRGQTGGPAGPQAAELRLVLLGTIGCGKTLSADTILGQRSSDIPFVSSRCCHVRSGVVEGRRVTVVEAPRWYWDGGHMESDVRRETEQALRLVAPGPHAFLLLVPIGQFTEVEGRVPGELEEVFGSEVLRHTLVLLTCGDYLTGRDPNTLLDREDPGLREVIRHCSGRYHVINNRQPHDREQVVSLIEKVEEMTLENGGCFVKTEVVTKERGKERATERTEADGTEVEREGKGRTPAVLVRITNAERGSDDGLREASPGERRREEERAEIEERVAVKPRADGLRSACVAEPQNGRPLRPEKTSSFRLTSDGALLSQLSEEVKPAKKVVNTFHHRINSFEDKSLSPEPYSPSSSSRPPFISSSPPSSSSPTTSTSSLSTASSSSMAYSLPSIPPVSLNLSPPESVSSLDDSSSSPRPPPSSSYPRPSSYLSFFSSSSSSSSLSSSSLPTSSPSSSVSSSTASHSSPTTSLPAETTSSSSPQISSNRSSTSLSQSSSSSTPMSSSKSSLSSSQQPDSFSQSSSSSSPISSSKSLLSSSLQPDSLSQNSSSSSPTSSSKSSLSSSEQPNLVSQSTSFSSLASSSKSSVSSSEQPNLFSQSSSSSSPASSSKSSLPSSEQLNLFSQSSSSSSPASTNISSLSYSQLADSISRSSYPSSPVSSSSPPSSSSFVSSSSAPELRLILLGRSGSGKSAAGNTILHSEDFVSRPKSASGSVRPVATTTQQCEKKKAVVAGRRLAVVDTPDWLYSEHTPDQVRSQISSCVTLSTPGPHAFLLCVPVDEPAKAELQSLRALEAVFGAEAVRKHTLVLFTHADRLMDCGKVAASEGVPGVEAYIASKRGDLLKVVERCGDRYHVLERGGREDERRSVEELLEKVEQSVQDGGGACYSCPAFQEAEDRVRERQEEMARERRGGDGGRGGHKDAERRVLYRSMQTVRESEEEEENEGKEAEEMERMRDEAEKMVSNMNLESLPILSSSTLSPSMFQIMWEKVAEGAKMVPEILGSGVQDVPKMMGSVAELVSESSLWEKIGAGVKKTPQIGTAKLGLEGDFTGESSIGEKDGRVQRQQLLEGARPTQLGSEFDLNTQNSMWEKVGAGVKQFPQLVGSGAKMAAKSSMWEKVGAGVKQFPQLVNAGAQSVGTGAKIVAESSMWQKVTEEAKKVPKPVAGGAFLGLVLGLFCGGPLGGAVGAGVGGLGSEVARRKLTNTKPMDNTDGTTPKQVDRVGATLADETVVWGGNQAVLKQSPQLKGARPTQLGSEFDLRAQNSIWEKVGAGVKQFPQLVGSGAKMAAKSSMWEKVGAGVKQFPQLVNAGAQSVGTGAKIVAESSMWQKATEEAKKIPKPVAGGALAGLVLGGFFGGPLGGAVGAGVGGLGSEVARRKLTNTKPMDNTDGTTPKQVDRVGATLADETVVWGGNQAVLKQSPQLKGARPTQLGSEFDLRAQNSIWEKVGAGVKQFPQLVGSGAKMAAKSSMWEKVGAGVKQFPQLVNAGAQSVGTGAKIVAESSMWQKAMEEAKKIPKPVAGGALAGLVLGGFFGGPLGGVVGAGVGGLGSEVARRKLTNTKPLDNTDGTTPKQVDNGLNILNSQKQLKRD